MFQGSINIIVIPINCLKESRTKITQLLLFFIRKFILLLEHKFRMLIILTRSRVPASSISSNAYASLTSSSRRHNGIIFFNSQPNGTFPTRSGAQVTFFFFGVVALFFWRLLLVFINPITSSSTRFRLHHSTSTIFDNGVSPHHCIVSRNKHQSA